MPPLNYIGLPYVVDTLISEGVWIDSGQVNSKPNHPLSQSVTALMTLVDDSGLLSITDGVSSALCDLASSFKSSCTLFTALLMSSTLIVLVCATTCSTVPWNPDFSY